MLNISIFDVIYLGYEKVLLKEGMLVVKELGRRGNLWIKFDIDFFMRLSVE